MQSKKQEASTEKFFAQLKAEKARECLSATLKRLGYEVFTPQKSKRITARLKDTQRGMNTWNLVYEVSLRFEEENGGCLIQLTISESNYNFSKAYCQKKLTELIDALDEDVRDFIEIDESKAQSTTHGSARFATEKELEEAGYLVEEIDSRRLLLAPWEGSRYIAVPEAETNRHCLVRGPTGAGKSTGFFIPNICARLQSSCIVTEATAGLSEKERPDLYVKTAGWRHHNGSAIYYFNPSDLSSTRINPLDKVRASRPDEVAFHAEDLAQLVILNTSPPTAQRVDPIWDKAEKYLLWILIMHVVAADDPEVCHFGAIRNLLRASEKVLREILDRSKSEVAAAEYKAFLMHSSENFRHGVFAGLLQRLNAWLTANVVTLTKETDLDIQKLQTELFSFYLSVPSRKQNLKPIAALIFNYLLDLALDNDFEYPLALFLDEFTNFGAIPAIDEALSIIRRRRIPVVLGVQTDNQITDIYGRNKTEIILDQLATKVVFRPQKLETAESVSRELGMKTETLSETNASGFTSYREVGRPLLTVSDLRTMQSDEVILMPPGIAPIKTKRFDYRSYPAPTGYEPPAREVHKVVVPAGDERKERSEGVPEPKKQVTEEERDFITKRTSELKKEQDDFAQEKQKKLAPRINLENEDWNIP
jgi:type IV secretory pathway TraG/TraD family ATPase VirD4